MSIFDDDDDDDDDVGTDARDGDDADIDEVIDDDDKDGDDCDVDDDEVVDDVCNFLTKILTIALPCNLGIFMQLLVDSLLVKDPPVKDDDDDDEYKDEVGDDSTDNKDNDLDMGEVDEDDLGLKGTSR